MGLHFLSKHTHGDLLRAPFFRLSLYRPPTLTLWTPPSQPPAPTTTTTTLQAQKTCAEIVSCEREREDKRENESTSCSKWEESKFPTTNSLWPIFEDTFGYSRQTEVCFVKLSTESLALRWLHVVAWDQSRFVLQVGQ